MSMKRFTIEELIEHCERQKKRMGAMCVNSANILLLEHVDTAEYLKELKEYKAAEEHGLLIRLPVPIGGSVYILDYTFECKLDYKCDDPCEFKCNDDIFCEHEYKKYRIREAKFKYEMLEYIGKTAFLTREEAEAALAEMEG